MDSDPHIPAPPDWLHAEAYMTVAAMLDDEPLVRQLDSLMPRDGEEFEQGLIGRELGLMADQVAPAEITFRIAMIRSVRDVLVHQEAIRALPAAAGDTARR